jgi:hypothetical protein
MKLKWRIMEIGASVKNATLEEFSSNWGPAVISPDEGRSDLKSLLALWFRTNPSGWHIGECRGMVH